MIVILCFHLLPILTQLRISGTPSKWNRFLRSLRGFTYQESTVYVEKEGVTINSSRVIRKLVKATGKFIFRNFGCFAFNKSENTITSFFLKKTTKKHLSFLKRFTCNIKQQFIVENGPF